MTKEGKWVTKTSSTQVNEWCKVKRSHGHAFYLDYVSFPGTPYSLDHASLSATCPITFVPSPGLSSLQIPSLTYRFTFGSLISFSTIIELVNIDQNKKMKMIYLLSYNFAYS